MPRSAISTASLNRCASGESDERSTFEFYDWRYRQPGNGTPRTDGGHGAVDDAAELSSCSFVRGGAAGGRATGAGDGTEGRHAPFCPDGRLGPGARETGVGPT